ncbi:hypothetical protein AWENTII_011250 [Aspergillus wentii]
MDTAALSSLTAMATTTALTATSSGAVFSVLSAPSPSSFPVPSQAPTAPGDVPGGDDNGECKLLGPFSLFVQAALGGLALLSLVYKRWRERPQRPVKVWAFDVSKQVLGTAMLHLANLLMSMFSAGQFEITTNFKPNPCSYYLLNLGIDTTLGIPILIFILRVLNALAFYTPLANPPESIESGNYGSPPCATWWLKQSIIYFIGLLGMKTCVFVLIQLLPFIVKVGDWALRWTEGNTAVQIFFVMLLFPVIMNAIQYYIIDTFIKKQPPSHELLLAQDYAENALMDDEHGHRSALLEDERAFESDDDSMGKGTRRPSHMKEALSRSHTSTEYDPILDGETGSVSAGSSSHEQHDSAQPATNSKAQHKGS